MWRRRPVPRGALTLAVGPLAAGIAIAVGATGVRGVPQKLGDADGLVRLGSMQLSGRTEPCVVWTLPSG
jgi:hypothetical protein